MKYDARMVSRVEEAIHLAQQRAVRDGRPLRQWVEEQLLPAFTERGVCVVKMFSQRCPDCERRNNEGQS